MIKWSGRSTSGISKWKFEAETMNELYNILVDKGVISIVDGDPYEIALLEKVGLKDSDFNDEISEQYHDNYYEWVEEMTMGIYLSENEIENIIRNENGNAYYQEFEIVED